jgi:hypothetical protein
MIMIVSRKLKTAPDWSEWQQAEGVMLDQYEEQFQQLIDIQFSI